MFSEAGGPNAVSDLVFDGKATFKYVYVRYVPIT
jgi:hypothetical protein